ncbi:hypothetical protein QWY85_20930 [Neolewinella lacunae]|uniref:hypothetical protein n=1 Tax=Neolewinella lacunae TaxID=1517758 RepID=UPI001CA406E7|nr:hypothetical protein [Neolewinella lacunae]MDN3637149.1 hypothetical protein [Neolewinella lacunae]
MIGHGFEPEDLDGRRGKHRFGYWLIIVRAEEPPICLMPYTAWATLQILGRLYKIINMGLREVKMELEKLDKDKLINLIVDLYKNNKSAKEFFDFYVQPNDLELFKKYRDKVFEAFYPKRGFGYKLKDGKQAISD